MKEQTLQEQFIDHDRKDDERFLAGEARFDKMDERFDNQDEVLERIESFMSNMSGISDAVRGVGLLKKPALWLLAFVLGIIMFTGGIKTILLTIGSWLSFK